MKIMLVSVIGLLTALEVVAQTPSDRAAGLMTPGQFQALPSKPADYRLSYGTDANQFGELRVPSGVGPHPVAILIHGGCWKAEYGSLRDLAPIADMLKAKGIATWNIEYRRLPQAGSGWPGTYLDVGRGVDYIRSIAVQNHLDLTRVIVVGHSSGGQMAMWVAARSRLPKSSLIYISDPLPIRGAIDLAGIIDMEAFIPVEQQICGGAVVEQMLGGKPAEVPDHYAQASANKMLPVGVPQTFIWGQRDQFNPASLGEKYTQTAEHAGDRARMVSLPEVGHFEIASPFSATWPAVEGEILSLLAKRP
ncbi:MAG: Acetyl esterase/lipase [Edaphobacter sp.]|nr:Acetyl esterase/lipase [Edaphobacter sp.]